MEEMIDKIIEPLILFMSSMTLLVVSLKK